jgi:AcrR family transcriptional regulator
MMATVNVLARGGATRTANKLKRRERILSCAGDIIAADGVEGFTLSKLAERADVTIPTIHNLLGKKSEIYALLVDQMMGRLEDAFGEQQIGDPVIAVETFFDSLISLFASNEALYKGALVAGEQIQLFEHQTQSGIFARSLVLARRVCETALANGELEGRISSELMAAHLFDSQRIARQDWMNGYTDLATYRTKVLTNMFIALCADASPALKERLLAKISGD